MTATAIKIQALQYSVRDHWTYRSKELLKPFDLSVKAGEAFGFLGHNGAGKTTTIKCILNFLRPTSGSIELFGVDSRHASSRASIGYLSEQPYFYDYLTVEETLSLFARLSNCPAVDRQSMVQAAAERVGIEGRLSSRMRTLSKGLTQRVGLAQAILHKPQLLILDEPFSGLDPIGRREFRDIFVDLKRAGTTIFMCSHVLPDVEFLCDRVSILSRGELRGVYDLQDLPTGPSTAYELTVSARVTEALARVPRDGVIRQTEDREGTRFTFDSRDKAEQALAIASQDKELQVVRYSRERGNLEQLFESQVSFKEGGR